ncbi:MAG: hypothetical protein MJ092_06380 [Lachnospiraceae bacterium]|nr:hypothetical protein [Lachnospiraceae bacterium]
MDTINEYLDLSHEYRILVPKDKVSEEILYRGEIYDIQDLSNYFHVMEFHEDVYGYLEDRLFDFINIKLDILINMYDEEILEPDQIDEAITVTNEKISESSEERFTDLATEFLNLLIEAKNNNTIVGFYF